MLEIIRELDRNKEVVVNLLEDITTEAALWKRDEKSWCLLEVICHLYDEEREDFRARFQHILEKAHEPFVPINPQAWVEDREYINQDFYERVLVWKMERQKSIDWLITLKNPNLDSTHHHPKLGPMSAKFMLANWLAHDYLHIRQIERIKYEYLAFRFQVDLNYAGNW